MSTITIPKKLTGEIKSFIVRAIEEVLHDLDSGLELTERAKRRLRQAASSKRKNIPLLENEPPRGKTARYQMNQKSKSLS